MLHVLTVVRKNILPFLASILLWLLCGAGCTGSQQPGESVPTGQPPEQAKQSAGVEEMTTVKEALQAAEQQAASDE